MNIHALRVLALVLTFAVGPSYIQAQTPTEGARVRVTLRTPPGQQHTGRLQSVTDASLRVSEFEIPRDNIARLELSTGRRPNPVTGVVGLLAGIVVGSVIACDANRDSYDVFCGGQNDTKIVIGATLGGLIGGAAGAFLFRREQWQPVDPATINRRGEPAPLPR